MEKKMLSYYLSDEKCMWKHIDNCEQLYKCNIIIRVTLDWNNNADMTTKILYTFGTLKGVDIWMMVWNFKEYLPWPPYFTNKETEAERT